MAGVDLNPGVRWTDQVSRLRFDQASGMVVAVGVFLTTVLLIVGPAWLNSTPGTVLLLLPALVGVALAFLAFVPGRSKLGSQAGDALAMTAAGVGSLLLLVGIVNVGIALI